MGTLAIYDVTGIQHFIFSSNKLKENLGGSIVIQKLFEDYLIKALLYILDEQKTNRSAYMHCRTDWKNCNDFLLPSDKSMMAEVIYIGGGNAMIAFPDIEIAKAVTKQLSRYTLKESDGALTFAVAYIPTTYENFHLDQRELFQNLKKNKQQRVLATPLLGIGITRAGDTDGLPAWWTEKDGKRNRYFSKASKLRLDTWEGNRDYFKSLLFGISQEFPEELDKLGQMKGDYSYIAVIHIDGNNMGKKINQILENSENFAQTIINMRHLSNTIDEKYHEVMGKVIKQVQKLSKEEESEFYKLFDASMIKKYLPIRPIVLNGDDVTFVCNGKIGVYLAELFLKELDKIPEIEIEGKKIKLTASAGIAIVKSHFPFYRAYELAEELCSSAKMKGKVVARLMNIDTESVSEVANWLDFHMVQGGITTDLATIREKHYKVPGMDEPFVIEYKDSKEKKEMKYTPYNLLWRPWCVCGAAPDYLQWDQFKMIFHVIKHQKIQRRKGWPSNRINRLRAEMTKSKMHAENARKENDSRGYYLPIFDGTTDIYPEKFKPVPIKHQTPYFDALELYDFYLGEKE